MTEANAVINALGLIPHPEGGFYLETYRADETIETDGLPSRYCSPRSHATAIYYLIEKDNFSALHRVASDEIFHFYMGDPVELFTISPSGSGQTQIIGTDIAQNQRPQVRVPKGVWQGLRVAKGGTWTLLGATVAPGFDFDDFEMGDANMLADRHPELKADIRRFTRSL